MMDGTLKVVAAGRCRGWHGGVRPRAAVRVAALALAATVVCSSAAVAKDKPADKDKAAAPTAGAPIRIMLSSMGFQTLQNDFLLAGSSMLTVHFVDRDHLLVTFSVRRLMKREPDISPNEDDRVVGANLVELPSGKVVAKTEWRLHDRSQYLWPLGHGRFALRVRDRLTMLAPLAPESAGDAFHEYPLLKLEGHIVAVLTSPDDDLLTVETTRYAMAAGETSAGFSLDSAPVQMQFYRLVSEGSRVADLKIVSAGTIRTQTAVSLPMTGAGRLETVADGKDKWLFNFDEHAGKVDELAGFETTCTPRATLVGRGEFVAFGCHGSTNTVDLAGFNFKGEEMWQQNFYESHVAPRFAFAPAGGRFALGRTLVTGDVDPDGVLTSAAVSGQEVRVYQSYNGRQIFKTDLSPVERAGENFALSPDGMRLAVVRETMVKHPATADTPSYTQNEAELEVYPLPALSKEDQAAVDEARKLAPVDAGARIDQALARTTAPKQKAEPVEPPSPVAMAAGDATITGAAVDTPSTQAGTEAVQSAAPEGVVEEGDVQPSGPRKKPTLYGPDEAPAKKPK